MTIRDLRSQLYRSERQRRPTLEGEVKRFAKQLVRDHPDLFSTQSRAGKTRVLSLLAHHLPPYPARSGRKPAGYISEAVSLFRQQRTEIAEGKRKDANWGQIARAVITDFRNYRTDLGRRHEIAKLREAVYSRLRRERQRAANSLLRRSRK